MQGTATPRTAVRFRSVPPRNILLKNLIDIFYLHDHKYFMTKYDVWTDGSYRAPTRKVGAGWVIKYGDVVTEGSASLPKLSNNDGAHGSDIGELLAFQSALSQIPDHSIVDARLDCQNIIDWLESGAVGKNKRDIPSLMVQFESARQRMACMKAVNLIKVSSTAKGNHNHARAHELSRIASHTVKQGYTKPPER